jgi:hypothetical protein
MEDEVTYQQRMAREKLIRDEKQRLCKNTQVSYDYEKKELAYSGCKNERRNGSAWCQKCSDAYKSAPSD